MSMSVEMMIYNLLFPFSQNKHTKMDKKLKQKSDTVMTSYHKTYLYGSYNDDSGMRSHRIFLCIAKSIETQHTHIIKQATIPLSMKKHPH